MRSDLASMWCPSNKAGNPRRISGKTSFPHCDGEISSSDDEDPVNTMENMKSMKVEETCCFFSIFILLFYFLCLKVASFMLYKLPVWKSWCRYLSSLLYWTRVCNYLPIVIEQIPIYTRYASMMDCPFKLIDCLYFSRTRCIASLYSSGTRVAYWRKWVSIAFHDIKGWHICWKPL